MLELDVNDPDAARGRRRDARRALGPPRRPAARDRLRPRRRAGRQVPETPSASAVAAFETSAFSLKALAAALLPLLERGEAAGVVGLDFDASVAWPAYDWAGVSKAALESINRYLARDLGPRGVRSNLVAAGPLQTVAASNIEGFDGLAQIWERQAPLGWDLADPSPVADACLFLLSPLARAITGEILHVDGGVHAIGAAPMPAASRRRRVVRRRRASFAAKSAPRGSSPGAARLRARSRTSPSSARKPVPYPDRFEPFGGRAATGGVRARSPR